MCGVYYEITKIFNDTATLLSSMRECVFACFLVHTHVITKALVALGKLQREANKIQRTDSLRAHTTRGHPFKFMVNRVALDFFF